MDEDALRIQASPARTKVSSLFPTESLEAKYLKKIHFWVQFLGIVVMVQIAGGLLVLVIVLSSS